MGKTIIIICCMCAYVCMCYCVVHCAYYDDATAQHQPRGITGVPVGDDAEQSRRCAVCQEELQVKHSDDEDCWVYADTVRWVYSGLSACQRTSYIAKACNASTGRRKVAQLVVETREGAAG